MALKATEKANTRIKELLSKKAAEKAQLLDDIEKQQNEIQTNDAVMEEAITTGDLDAYKKAKADKEAAAELLEIYKKRTAYIKNKALITKEEYKELLKDISDEAKAACDNAAKKITKLADEMFAVAADLEADLLSANSVIDTLETKVYKEPEGKGHAIRGSAKLSNEFECVLWGKSAVNHWGYEKYAGKEKPETESDKRAKNKRRLN